MSRAKRARGSFSPAIRFSRNGSESIDREGITAPLVTTSVGTPITLSAFVQDRGERNGYDVDSLLFPVGTEWILHQGPAAPEFERQSITGRERDEAGEGAISSSDEWAEAKTLATFTEPGDYVIRLRVDNFMAPDSKMDNQCCWSNAFLPVKVMP
jgi:hypothetical protein